MRIMSKWSLNAVLRADSAVRREGMQESAVECAGERVPRVFIWEKTKQGLLR